MSFATWHKPTAGVCSKPNRRLRGRYLAILWFAVFGVLAGACFWQAVSGSPPPKSPSQIAAMASTPSVTYRTKRIDEIRVGDIVMARDEFGNELGLKRVVEVYRRVSDHLRILKFESEDAQTQTLETTNEHPFWVVNHDRFVNAAHLSVGDEFTGPNGEATRLVSTEYEPHPEGVPVYNFKVEDYHTYFVNGTGSDVTPILVHNTCRGLKWTDENAHMSKRARDYGDSATGARSNIHTQSSQVPALLYDNPFGGRNSVRFDGLDGDVLIDRKISTYGSKKAKLQARRQAAAAQQNGKCVRWEVPNQAAATRAKNMLEDLDIDIIHVTVVPE